MSAKIENIVIIGSSPASYTAGIYAATANLNPLIIETGTGDELDIKGSDKIAGLTDIKDPLDFIRLTKDQAKRFNVKIEKHKIIEIYSGDLIRIITSDNEIITKSCIIDDRIIATTLLNRELFNEDMLIICKEGRSITQLSGVFACGGSKEKFREAVIFASSGCKAALDAKEYIERLG